MSTRRRPALSLILAIFLSVTAAAQSPPAPSRYMPQDTLLSIHISRPKALIEVLAGKTMTEAVTALPLYQQQATNPKFKEFLNVVKFLEMTLETDWRTGLGALTAGGITVAIYPDDIIVAIVDADDERILTRLHEILLSFARSEAEKQGYPERVASKEYAGVTAWTFGGNEAHAIVGKRLIFANHAEGLKAAVDRGAQPEGKSLATDPTFQAAMRAAGSNAPVTAFVNLKPLMGLPQIAGLLAQSQKNPLAALAFAGISESFANSSWLTLGLDVRDETLTVHALTDGKPVGPKNPAAFSIPQQASDGVWPNLSVPRRLAALSLYRDLEAFYAGKDTLFSERTSGLIFFENMMGIFFSGRDLTSEVLAETQPHIRLVVAEQQFDPAIGTPQVRLPAFAAVLRLRHPEPFRKVVEEAWQKAVGLINFTRGQQALPGLIIDRVAHGETKYTVAYFSTADAEDKAKLDTRFNARPALAMPGEYLILSSTDGLARDLIDALSRESDQPVKPMPRTHSAIAIDGAGVVSALQANRETLVRGDMIKKGRSQTEAAAGIDMLINVVTFIDQLTMSVGMHEDLTEVQLQMKLNLPR